MTKKIHNPLEEEHDSNPDVMALLGTLEGSANNLVLQNGSQGIVDASSFANGGDSVPLQNAVQGTVQYNPQMAMNNNFSITKQLLAEKILEYKKQAAAALQAEKEVADMYKYYYSVSKNVEGS